MELCIYNQKGFCKFGSKCKKTHENKVCENKRECTTNGCRFRHPRLCKYFSKYGHCKFGEGCAFSHTLDNKNIKIESLEKEVTELKEAMMKMKQELSEKLDKEVSETKEDIRMLKDDVSELKSNVSELKKLLAYMNRKINAIEPLQKVKTNETKESNEKAEMKENPHEQVKGSKEADSKHKESRKPDQKFKCEMCSYETKKKITLKKHINMKHCSITSKGETNDEKEAVNNVEESDTICETCDSCESCDYLKNAESCEMCRTLMYVWAGKQCGVDFS